MYSMTGVGDLPSKMIMSQPAFFSSPPKKPPELEQATQSVSGLLATTDQRPAVEALVPVSGPVAMMSLFSGERASTVGETSVARYFVASPRCPRYLAAHSMLVGSSLTVPSVKFTRSRRFAQLIVAS